MRFLLHGSIHPDVAPALIKHQHAVHSALELSGDTDAPAEILSDPELLLGLLEKKQWNLLTTDGDFVQQLYEQKVDFPGIIVLLLEPDAATESNSETPAGESAQPKAIDRLFERYPRLTPRRLYTITPSRVKIRQLPGAAQA